MKKSELVVGETYAYKDDSNPYKLLSLELLKKHSGEGAYLPAPTGSRPRKRTYYGDAIGYLMVWTKRDNRQDLEKVERPDFLDLPLLSTNKATLLEMGRQWEKALPDTVRTELVNPTQLEGPYDKVMEDRRTSRLEQDRRYEEAKRISAKYDRRYEFIVQALNEYGVRPQKRTFKDVYPDEKIYVSRVMGLVMSIEDMEHLLTVLQEEE